MSTKKYNNPYTENFDWIYYLKKYPDLKEHKIKTKKKAIEHYLTKGINELRFPNIEDEMKNQLKDGLNRDHKVVVASTQWPGYGGSATNAYNIVKFLRNMGYRTVGIFFENKDCDIDPDNVKGIWRIDRKLKNYVEHFGDIVHYLGGVPNFCLGKNYIAPILLKKMFPVAKNYYLVSGSIHMTHLAKYGISARKFINSNIEKYNNYFNDIKNIIDLEKKCFQKSDLIIPNSTISLNILKKVYPKYKNKLKHSIDVTLATTATSIKKYDIIKKSKRDIDIIFIVSNVLRKVKNSDFVKKLFKNKKLKIYRKVVVGKNSDMFKDVAETIGFSKNNVIKSLLANSKLIILPSFFDANPNVIQEALAQDCIPLISKNTGGYERFDNNFVCDNIYDENLWIEKIQYLVNNYKYFVRKIEETKLWTKTYEMEKNVKLLKNILQKNISPTKYIDRSIVPNVNINY